MLYPEIQDVEKFRLYKVLEEDDLKMISANDDVLAQRHKIFSPEFHKANCIASSATDVNDFFNTISFYIVFSMLLCIPNQNLL